MYRVDAVTAARMYLEQQQRQREQQDKDNKKKKDKSFAEELMQGLIEIIELEERKKNSSFQEKK